MGATYKIAVIPGDGIGKETVPESLKVLDAAARRFNFSLKFAHYDWSCETYKKTGAMMPADGMDRLANPTPSCSAPSAGPTSPTTSPSGVC